MSSAGRGPPTAASTGPKRVNRWSIGDKWERLGHDDVQTVVARAVGTPASARDDPVLKKRRDVCEVLDAVAAGASLDKQGARTLGHTLESWQPAASQRLRLAITGALYAAATAPSQPWDLVRVARELEAIGDGRWLLHAWLLADLTDMAAAGVRRALSGEGAAAAGVFCAERAARALKGLLRGVHRCAANSSSHGGCCRLGQEQPGCVCACFDIRLHAQQVHTVRGAAPPQCLLILQANALDDAMPLLEAASVALAAHEASGQQQHPDGGRPQQRQRLQEAPAGGGGGSGGSGGSSTAVGGSDSGAASAVAGASIRMDVSRWHPAITAAVRHYASSPWSPLLVPCRVTDLWAGLPDAVLFRVAALANSRRVWDVCKAWRAAWLATVHAMRLPADRAGMLVGLRNLRRLEILEPVAAVQQQRQQQQRPGSGPAGAGGAGGEAGACQLSLSTLLAPAVGAGGLRRLECLTIQRHVPAASAGGPVARRSGRAERPSAAFIPNAGHLADLPPCLSALAGSLTSVTVRNGRLQRMSAVVASLTCLRELCLRGNALATLLPGGNDGQAGQADALCGTDGSGGGGAACTKQQQQQQQQAPAAAPLILALPSSLELLDVSRNRLARPEGLEALAGLTRLRRLFLNDNDPPPQGLPQCMTALTALTALDLGQTHSQRSSRSSRPPPLPLPASLRQLRIRGCRWTRFPPEICGCTALEQLDCEDHAFHIIPDQISRLRNLRDLNLGRGPNCLAPWSSEDDPEPWVVSGLWMPTEQALTQLTALTRLVVDEGLLEDAAARMEWAEKDDAAYAAAHPHPSTAGVAPPAAGVARGRDKPFDVDAHRRLRLLTRRGVNPVRVVQLSLGNPDAIRDEGDESGEDWEEGGVYLSAIEYEDGWGTALYDGSGGDDDDDDA